MITVYHLETSRSERIIWLLEELELPYAVERFARESGMMAPAAFKALHPRAKSPMIRDGELVLTESGAIIEYVIHRHAGGRLAVPPAAPEYARYVQWMHAAEGTVMTQFILELYVTRLIPGIDPSLPIVAWTSGEGSRLVKYIDDELGSRPYFAGAAFTAADIMMTYCFGLLRGFMKRDLSPYRNILAYLDCIEQRPAYRKAMAIANPTTA